MKLTESALMKNACSFNLLQKNIYFQYLHFS